jgi:dUTP pyrophosphatase
MSNLKYTKTHPNAKAPTRNHPHDGGLNLTAATLEYNNEYGFYQYDTYLTFEIPPGYVGLITPMSDISETGLSFPDSVKIVNSSFRGSVKIRFYKETLAGIRSKPYEIGDQIAQLLIVPIRLPLMVECTELSESDRGDGGFGSTDAKKG